MTIIRNVKLEDAQGIIELLNPIFISGKHSVLTEPVDLASQQQFIKSFTSKGSFIVSKNKQDQIVGVQDIVPIYSYAAAFRHVCEIATFVSIADQRSGIGSKLMAATKKQAQEKGYKKIVAMIRADNASGLSYYQKHGFQQFGLAKKHAFINGQYIDEVMTECWL